jgi:PTS hybrid protein
MTVGLVIISHSTRLAEGVAELAAEIFTQSQSHDCCPVIITSAPLVEGAVVAAVEASTGSDLQTVATAAETAVRLTKIHTSAASSADP